MEHVKDLIWQYKRYTIWKEIGDVWKCNARKDVWRCIVLGRV